jgi:hypothetical protein
MFENSMFGSLNERRSFGIIYFEIGISLKFGACVLEFTPGTPNFSAL